MTASSAGEQDLSLKEPSQPESIDIAWVAPRAGKLNRNLRCDWLPKRAKWRYLACS